MERNVHTGNTLSRRSFVAGAAAVAGASALLAGYAKTPAQATESASASGAADGDAATSDAAAGSEVPETLPTRETANPNFQVEESVYGTGDKELTMLFSPIQVGGKTLKNRIVKSGAGCPASFDENGYPNEQLLSFYESIAKGGAGYVVIDTNSMPVDALKLVADRVHPYGAMIGMQHYSMTNWIPGGLSSGSSPVTVGELDFSTTMPTMATLDDIANVEQQFIDRAKAAFDAGFDGFEINAGCNHFLNSFLSRAYNTDRTDDYDASSLENRARIITDIISGIRDYTGDDFIIGVLYNVFEVNATQLGDNELCTSMEEGIEFAKIFEAAGASMLHLRWGVDGNHAASFFPDRLYIDEPGATGYGTVMDFPRGAMGDFEYRYGGTAAFAPVAKHVKDAVSIPVGTVGCMDPRLAPDLIEQGLEDGQFDLCYMTRPLMADPELPNKLQEGRRDEIAPCTHCETCFMDSIGGCRVNPIFSKAGTDELPGGYDYPQAETPLNVLVVGGGPAGMEAARVSALCGHNVTLCEKTSTLGGKLPFAEMVKGTHELIDDYDKYLQRQLEVTGVTVQLDTEVDASVAEEFAPDRIIVASGASYAAPDIEGWDSCSIASELAGGLTCADGQRVVLVGNGVQIINMAEYLVGKNCIVTIVNPKGADVLAEYMPSYIQTPTLNWLKAHAATIYNGATIESVSGEGVTFVTSFGLEKTVPADAILHANQIAADDLTAALSGVCDDVVAVGDAKEPGNIVLASATAHFAARGETYVRSELNASMPDMAAAGNEASGGAPASGDAAAAMQAGASASAADAAGALASSAPADAAVPQA